VWARQLENSPLTRLWEGLSIEKLQDPSYARAEDNARFSRTVLDRLGGIDPSALEHDDWLTYEVLRRDAEMTVEGLDCFWFGNVLTPYSTPLGELRQIFGALTFRDASETERYLDLLRQVPRVVAQVEAVARGAMEHGYVVSAANLPAATGLVRGSIQPAAEGPFGVAPERLAALDAASADEFLEQVAGVVETEINPALERLAAFLEGEYASRAPAGVGLSQYPDGDACYRYLVRLHTTMDVTPDEVQQIGYEMVAEMQQAVAAIEAEVGFAGTADELSEYIRTNPEVYPKTPEEVGQRIQAAADAFFARVDEFFVVLPRAPFAARRLDPALESSQTYGYYNPPSGDDPAGYYNFNGSRLDERTLLTLKGIAYHELFPGHHFHITRQFEDPDLHSVRRAALYTAYTEGWGSYSSLLGLEQGMLEDPLDRYGLYMLEIFLATRLVLDPGMNALGMSLDEARQFMRETTFESETQIATETLRYSTDMPGQALGYQMGKRRLLQLRARAEQALGDGFDLRAFHEAVLRPGALPMTVLDQHIDWFIEQELARGD